MPDAETRLYEGMFLFNPAEIQSSVATAAQTVQQLLERAEAQIEAIYKWDDRKLAYPIEGHKRGLYMLAYFRAPGSKINHIERDVNLSEQLLRCLIVRADHLGETELELARDKQKDTVAVGSLEGGGEEGSGESAEPRPEPAAESSEA